MADDDRRCVVASVGDADSAEKSTNSDDNPQTESKALCDDVAVASQPTEETPEDKTIPDATLVSTEVVSATQDAEEHKNRLALIKIEVEKPSAEGNVAASQSTTQVETEIEDPSGAQEAPAVTEHGENSRNEEKLAVQPETPKGEKLLIEASKYCNEKSVATEPNKRVEEDKSVTAHGAQSEVEIQTVKVKIEKCELVEDEEGEEEEVVAGEREEGEDEDAAVKALDADKDCKILQTIPKMGGFFEHDVRNRERINGAEGFLPVARGVVKKTKSVATDRWGHDKFDPKQQAPKSTQELISKYGHDIRQEAGALRFGLCKPTVGRRGGGNNNNSKENTICYRRTFEERREIREARGIGAGSDSVPPSGEGDEEQSADQPPKEKFRSPRRPTGGEASRGAPRGGSSRGTGIRGGALVHSEPPRGGASPRARGLLSLRGRRNDNPILNRGDEEVGNSRPVPPHMPFTRGPDASQDVCMNHQGRGKGKFGPCLNGYADQVVVGKGMEQLRIEDHSAPRNQDAASSKRYSSQRQWMTTPPPAKAGAAPIQQPPDPVPAGESAAYYDSYNDSSSPNYVSAAPAPLLPMAVAVQCAPPTFIAQPIYPAGPAPFNAGPCQGYIPAPASTAVPVGVPIGSPTQDYMYGGGTMYYDPGRQQPIWARRATAAIPIVAPDDEVDSWLISGRRLDQ